VSVPNTNGFPHVALTYTAGSSVDLTAGGADQLRVAYASIISSRTNPPASINVTVTGTDVNGRTRFASSSSGPNTDPGFLAFGFGDESYQFRGQGDLTAMKTLQLAVYPVDNQGGSVGIDITDFATVNPNGVPGPTTTDQTITFAQPTSPVAIGSSTSLSATATSGLPVTFTSTTPGVCTVSGASVTATAAGTCTITADQSGNGTYNAAPQVTRNITVAKTNQTITFTQPTSGVAIGSSTALSATASSGLAVTLTSLTTDVCRVVNGQAVADHAGTCTIAATQSGNGTYNAAPQVTRTITVAKTTQTITFAQPTSPVTIGSSTSLSATANSGLPVTFTSTTPGVCTVSGSNVTTTHAGTCTITADQGGNNDFVAAPTVTRSFDVSKTDQAITFVQPTSGVAIGSSSPLTATATSGLPVTLTSLTTDVCRVVNGQAVADHAGTCTIAATQTGNSDYNAATAVNRSITVDKTNQAITFTQPTSGVAIGSSTSLSATATSGLAVTLTSLTTDVCRVVNGQAVADHAGTCTIAATQTGNSDYNAATPVNRSITINKTNQTVTFIQPTSPVAIGSTTALSATASSGLAVTLTSLTTDVCRVVNGQAVADHAGTCTIAATQTGNSDYNAATAVNRSITVDKTAQAIGFTSQAPNPAYVGASYTVAATGGAGTAPVTFSTPTPATCSVAGSTVHFLIAGPCTVQADQAGDADHSAALPATQTITVTRVPASVTVSLDPTATVYGQPVSAIAVVSPASGSATGTVQFSVDGTPAGAPVAVSAGRATSAGLAPLAVGLRTVTAAYTPTDTTTYAPATGTSTLPVAKAATTTTVRVEPAALVTVVAPVAPGAGTPSGTVELQVDGAVVGTATVVNGTARLPYTVPAGASRVVAAAYSGDSSFTASSTSTARQDPTITATLSSPSTRSPSGWYAGPVTVTFACASPGAALSSPCPSPVVLDRDGAGQSVSRSVTSTDGGVATAVVSGINIDTVAPRVKLTGLRRGAQLVATTPKAPRCKATDSLSGVLTCTVDKKVVKTAGGTRVRYRAVATDRAGNTARSTRGARVSSIGLDGVRRTGGAYQTRAGSSYTLVVLGSAPRYRYATPAPGAPRGGNVALTRAGSVRGVARWIIGISVTPAMRSHRFWNLGVVQDGKLHTIRIRVR
jgi:hypothetical protein